MSASWKFSARLRAAAGGTALAVVALLAGPGSASATPSMVKNIWPEEAPYPASGVPGYPSARAFANVNGTLFFRAQDGQSTDRYTSTHGLELWRSDGTEAGTQMVKDINPGSADSSPGEMTSMGGILYFTAYTPQTGTDLWRSDGTSAGTQIVRNIPGADSFVDDVTSVNGTLYFEARDSIHGWGLWKSDGTSAGTTLVKNWGASPPGAMTPLGNTLYFAFQDDVHQVTHGYELWKSDGTAAGTRMVKDINTQPTPWGASGTDSSNPQDLVALGKTLYFTADDGVHGRELWRSDGTSAGTRLVKDMYPGSDGSSASGLARVGNSIYFFAVANAAKGWALWQTDGTAAGTHSIKVLGATIANSITVANGTVFFLNAPSNGAQLWQTNGTSASTHAVRAGDGSTPTVMGIPTPVGGSVYYAADDYASGGHGTELWRSDGTPAGTELVADINPNPGASSNPDFITRVGSRLFFSADDGTHGAELWQGP